MKKKLWIFILLSLLITSCSTNNNSDIISCETVPTATIEKLEKSLIDKNLIVSNLIYSNRMYSWWKWVGTDNNVAYISWYINSNWIDNKLITLIFNWDINTWIGNFISADYFTSNVLWIPQSTEFDVIKKNYWYIKLQKCLNIDI